MAMARPRPAIMTLTDAAASRVREIIDNSDHSREFLIIVVKNRGCSGMAFTLYFAVSLQPVVEFLSFMVFLVLISSKVSFFLLVTHTYFTQD